MEVWRDARGGSVERPKRWRRCVETHEEEEVPRHPRGGGVGRPKRRRRCVETHEEEEEEVRRDP